MPLDQRQRPRYTPPVDRSDQRIGVPGGLLFVRNRTLDFYVIREHQSPSWIRERLPRSILSTVYGGMSMARSNNGLCPSRGRTARSPPVPRSGLGRRTNASDAGASSSGRSVVRRTPHAAGSRPGLHRPAMRGCVARRVVVSRRRRATCPGAREAVQATHAQFLAHAVHHPARSRAGVAGFDRPRAPSATYAPLSASPG